FEHFFRSGRSGLVRHERRFGASRKASRKTSSTSMKSSAPPSSDRAHKKRSEFVVSGFAALMVPFFVGRPADAGSEELLGDQARRVRRSLAQSAQMFVSPDVAAQLCSLHRPFQEEGSPAQQGTPESWKCG